MVDKENVDILSDMIDKKIMRLTMLVFFLEKK